MEARGLTAVTEAVALDLQLLTAAEVAHALRCSARHVYRMARRGDLPCIRTGGMVRFPAMGVEALCSR